MRNELSLVIEKVKAGERISENDALFLFRSRDLQRVGSLADWCRQIRNGHGKKVYYVNNQHINYTNICINRCKFCAYSRIPGQDGGFLLTPEQVVEMLSEHPESVLHEIHVVGGIHPDLPFSYYIDLLDAIRSVHPKATIKAFTAVEIDHMAKISGLGLYETIARLKEAGLEMIPGGGAEILTQRVHNALFPEKIDGRRWMEVMKAIHNAGLTSNATMLYGHMETIEERITHLFTLRNLQDETGGFSAFIPLAFHPKNTQLSDKKMTTGIDDLLTIAISRIMLDNFDHIKAYWVMLGEKTAQIALHFGADDLDGTIVEEKISHMAGAESAKGLTAPQIEHLIRAAGFVPVPRNAFYQPV